MVRPANLSSACSRDMDVSYGEAENENADYKSSKILRSVVKSLINEGCGGRNYR